MSAKKSLNPLDRMFLAAESSESLMHVGSLIPFAPPPGGGRDVLRALRDELKKKRDTNAPWNLKLRHPDLLASPLQAWVEDTEFDIDYHVRRSALPSPGDERELGILVSRLHSNKTVTSYAGMLNFGFLGCRDALPHLQRLAVYSGEALQELEATLPP